jgi:hypothetical protein
MERRLLFICLIFVFSGALNAQDTLPKFSVKNVGANRYIISWVNAFETVKQISIQRSFDSLHNYKTILTVPDPTTPQNGYVDTKATNDHMFYRLYILLDKGVYLFSVPQKPVIDTLRKSNYTNKTDRIGKVDSVSTPNFGINNKNGVNVFTPSLHVYTNSDGYVRINLPEDEDKKYSLKFYEDDGDFLFELKDIRTRSFKIDKTNFYHAGWFRFELFENGKLIEKHKFFLQKDF